MFQFSLRTDEVSTSQITFLQIKYIIKTQLTFKLLEIMKLQVFEHLKSRKMWEIEQPRFQLS
jgi:hypothetical protein